jgi:hypothetical protein
MQNDEIYQWEPGDMLEVILPDPDAFLKIRETLSRIGVASKQNNTLFQSCHVLHKQGKYYICSFKEMFLISGKEANLSFDDIKRRNTIANLLEQWGLCKMVTPDLPTIHVGSIKIVPYKEKKNWQFIQKYTMQSDRTRAKQN